MSMPFTYYLYHIPTGKKYYGVRYSKNCHPNDLWTKYFSSSSIVKDLIKQYGKESFKYEIRKIFKNAENAKNWESTVHRRLKIDTNDNWLNRHIQSGKFKCSGHSVESRKKISKAIKGRVLSEEHKRKISEKSIIDRQRRRDSGWKMPKDDVLRRANMQRGIARSPEMVTKMRQSKKGTKRFYLPDGTFIMKRPD